MKSTHSWDEKELSNLYAAVLKLKTTNEVAKFLRDLCTKEELIEMGKRWQAARMLDQGKSYRDVAEETGLSTSTVARVAQWLHGGEGGYRAVLSRLPRPKGLTWSLKEHVKLK